MTTLELNLPDDALEFLQVRATQEGFENVNAYLAALIGQMRNRFTRKDWDEKIREGLRAPAVVMTRERWKQLEKDVLEGAGE